MNLNITARKMQVPQSFIDYAETKLQKLDRFFGKEADANITISSHKDLITLELTVKHDKMIYRAEQTASEKNEALDTVIDKIIRQIRKHKTKLEKRLHDTAFKDSFATSELIEEQHTFDVVKYKKFEMLPMSVEEAILQMNMLSHSFFMFRNAASGEINVVYRRSDGNYAVLQPEK